MTIYTRNQGTALASYGIFNHLIDFKELEVFDGKNLNRENSPILFHEYFHYYVQFNSLFFLEIFLHYFAQITQFAKRQPLASNIPLSAHPTTEMAQILSQMGNWRERTGYHFTNSDNVDFSNFEILGFEKGRPIVAPWGFECTIPSLRIRNSVSGNSRAFEFGEESLNEGAAYLLEVYFAHILGLDFKADHPNLPYTVLAQLIDSSPVSIFLPVLVLVDLSFQHPSPGQRFAELWKKFESDFQSFGSDAERDLTVMKRIYSTELNHTVTVDYCTQLTSILEKFVTPAIVKNPPFQWLRSKFVYGLDRLRAKRLPDYLIPILGSGDPLLKLQTLFSVFLPPIVLDRKTRASKDFVLFADAKDTQDQHLDSLAMNLYFRGVFQMFQYAWTGRRGECSAYRSCGHSMKTDAICLHTPERMADVKPLCEVGSAARMIGLGE